MGVNIDYIITDLELVNDNVDIYPVTFLQLRKYIPGKGKIVPYGGILAEAYHNDGNPSQKFLHWTSVRIHMEFWIEEES